MSTPKAKVLNRRIKISRSGRAYVDVADLVKTRLERIGKLHQTQNGKAAVLRDAGTGKMITGNKNSSNSNDR